MKELLSKIDKHEDLSRSDYWEMIDNYSIISEEGEDGRWTRSMYNFIKLEDRYFELSWQKGLTEMQEDYFDYPEEVEFHGYEEVVIKKKCPIIKRKYDDELVILY